MANLPCRGHSLQASFAAKPAVQIHSFVTHVTGLVSAHREPVAVIGGTGCCDMTHRRYNRGKRRRFRDFTKQATAMMRCRRRVLIRPAERWLRENWSIQKLTGVRTLSSRWTPGQPSPRTAHGYISSLAKAREWPNGATNHHESATCSLPLLSSVLGFTREPKRGFCPGARGFVTSHLRSALAPTRMTHHGP
jgi:hypothetical protein